MQESKKLSFVLNKKVQFFHQCFIGDLRQTSLHNFFIFHRLNVTKKPQSYLDFYLLDSQSSFAKKKYLDESDSVSS